MPLAAIAAVGVAVAAYGAYEQHQANNDQSAALRDQAGAQREQLALQKRQADIANARTLRAAVRQARIARGSIINAGANAGVLESSGVQGGASSVMSQHAANVDYFGQMGELNQQILDSKAVEADAAMRVGQAAGDSAEAGAIAGLGRSIFGAAGGFKTIFGG